MKACEAEVGNVKGAELGKYDEVYRFYYYLQAYYSFIWDFLCHGFDNSTDVAISTAELMLSFYSRLYTIFSPIDG